MAADPGLVFRVIDDNNYLLLTTFALLKRDGGAFTTLATFAPLASGTWQLRLELAGARIRAYQNEGLLVDYTLVGGDATKFTGPTSVGLREHGDLPSQWNNLSFVQETGPSGTLSAALLITRSLSGTQPASPQRVADTFDRANSGTLGTSSSGHLWTPSNAGWSVVGQTAVSNYAGGAPAIALLDTGVRDGTVTVELTEGINEDPSVIVRAVDSSTYLWCAPGGLFKVTSGSGGLLASFPAQGAGVTHTYRVEFRGKRILIVRSGAGVAVDYTLSDADYAVFGSGTRVGLSETTSAHGSVDNFEFLGDAGSLTRTLTTARAVAGAQPAASGTVARGVKTSARTLTGVPPAASGTVVRGVKSTARTLTGDQTAASGTLTRKLTALRTLSGAQPSASGLLTRREAVVRAVSGVQPFATGTVTRQFVTGRALTGVQPFAEGSLSYEIIAAPPVGVASRRSWWWWGYSHDERED